MMFGACIFMFSVAGKADVHAASNVNQAKTINVNKMYKGSLTNKKEILYKVTLPEPGNVTLSIKRNAKTSFEGHIQNSKGYIYTFVYTKRQDDTSGFDEVQVGLPKGTYYVRINNSGGQGSKADYQFSTKYTKSQYYEKESNDKVATANAINLNATYKGVISHSDDRDYFRFVVPQNGNVTLNMKQKRDTIWRGSIQDRSNKKLAELYSNENGSLTTYMKKGTYYFVMENYDDSVDVPYEFTISDRTSSLKASQINVTNNTGKSDSVKVSNLKKGDVVTVYDAKSKGNVIGKTTAKGTSVSFKVSQLGKKTGKVYVTVMKSPLRESDRVAQTFKGETSPSVKTSQVKVTNHKGKADTVVISSLAKGDVVKIYKAKSKGNMWVKGTAKGKKLTLSIKQLGKKSGKVYVTVTKSGQQESGRVAVSYKKEK
ncbi:hypothetical protein ACIQZM_07550 [Peribacillus sp. NPDC097206]|uniref:hypothetical protein n=2 Tax=unclassified Peribacillus TaxID=2675266 RepID=UPI003815C7E3